MSRAWPVGLAALLVTTACGERGRRGPGDGIDTDAGGDTDTAGDGDGPCVDSLPARRIRRLSRAEHIATLHDLFGAARVPSVTFAADNVVDGYANDATALTVSSLLADQYRVVAEGIAGAIVEDLDAWLPCDPVADGEAACARQLVVDLGRRAYRRPMTEEEIARLMALFDEIFPEDGFEESLRWVVSAMLQSPGFVYRTELGEPLEDGVWALTPHELATELSYLLVGTMPDELLAADADAGLLSEVEVLLEHAERLLTTPEAAATLHRFVEAWLRTGQLELVPRDELLTPEIRAAMRGELQRLTAEAFAGGHSLAELLMAEHSYMTDELAAFHGLPPGTEAADAEGFRRSTTDGPHRGLLVRGAILATHALPTAPSPVHRGLLVRERLMCQPIPPPPPGVVNGVPEVEPGSTNRERYAQHSEDPACAGCHQLIDPIGFAFEHYDALGRLRDQEDGKAIDAGGLIHGGPGSGLSFRGAQELSEILAEQDEVIACYAEQWAQFGLGGLAHDPGLRCMAQEVAAQTVAAGGRLDAVVAALVASPGFRLRRVDDGGGPSPPDDGTTGELPPSSDETTEGDGLPVDPDLEVVVTSNSTWATGRCDDVMVTNVSDAAVTWEVRLPIEGELTTVWSAVWIVEGADVVFTGVDFNMTLQPGHAATFGYCVETG